MGSFCEPSKKEIDASVGGLVWVRRRNGSWWPGQIMGQDELSESCLVSLRSGTPVKLLGREDASMDWYNLERSKRVKAFRCGEYDECIEKAKASAANSSKKVVKYARREDAILHALELESAQKSNLHKGFCSGMENSTGPEHCTSVGQSQKMFDPGKDDEHMAEIVSTVEGNSTQGLSQSGISFENPNHTNIPKEHSMSKKRRKNPNDSEDDGIEGTKRMRGLEDLGIGVVSRRTYLNFHNEGSHELVQLGASVSESNIGNSFSNGSPVSSSKGYCSALKHRRYQVANVHENLKRKDCRRPLTKVLECTAMVSVPIVCDQGASLGGSSFQGMTDSKIFAVESTTNFSLVINNNSDSTVASCEKETSLNASEHDCTTGVDVGHFHTDTKDNEYSSVSEFAEDDCSESLFDVPFVGEEKHLGGLSPLFASSVKLQSGAVGRESSRDSQVVSISLRSEGLDESGSTTFVAHANNVSHMIEYGSSKWQLKGKRNSRHPSKKTSKNLYSRRYADRNDRSGGFLEGYRDGSSLNFGGEVDINTFDGSLMSDNCAQLPKSRLASEKLGLGHGSWNWSNQVSYREVRLGAPNYLDNIKYGRQSSGNIEVVERNVGQSSSQEKYVSSSMPQQTLSHCQSRFTAHSRYQFAGAPIRNISRSSSLFDVKLDVRTTYRAQHVPLVSLMSKLNGKAIIGHPLTVEVLDDGYCDLVTSSIDCYPTSSRLYGSLFMNRDDNIVAKKVGTLQAQTSHAIQSQWEAQKNPVKHLPVQAALSPEKSPKIRKCGLLSKKTRKLSSLTVPHARREEERKPVVEKLGEPVIACVPLKVVFSRINEAVNCSTRPAQNILTSK